MTQGEFMQQSDHDGEGGSLLHEALRTLTGFIAQRAKLTLLCVAVLSAVSVAFTVAYIGFKTDRADLIDPDAAFQKRWINYTESFGDASDIVIVVEADRPERIKQVLDDLGTRLSAEPDLFTSVLYKIEPGRLQQKGLQYLSPPQLEAGLKRIAQFRPILSGHWDLIRIESLFDRLRFQIESQSRTGRPGDVEPLMRHAELLTGSLADYLADNSDFRSPWPETLSVDSQMRDEANQVRYILNDAGTMGFLKVLPVKASAGGFNGASRSIDRLREVVADVTVRYPQVQIGVTGIPVLENDEMRRSQSDMLTASLISFVGVGLLLFVGFRGFRHPMLALIMLAVGMTWAFGFTTLSVGHLNILSVSFAVILIGLGIDFGIHYLARYLQLRHEGTSLRPALLETSSSVGTGIITAAVTTALAFFCATLTQFLGVAELGIIAGGGVLLCAAATFLVLPALVSLVDRNVEPKRLPTPFQADLLRQMTSRHPRLVLVLSTVVVLGMGLQTLRISGGRIETRIRYDYNLLNLQAEGLESVEIQRRVFQDAHDSLLFAVSVADTAEEARAMRKRFEALPTVHHVEDLASRFPAYPSQETKLLVQAYRSQLSHLPNSITLVTNIDPSLVGRAMERLYLAVRNRRDATSKKLAHTLDATLTRLDDMSLKKQMSVLNAYQSRMTAALLAQFQALRAASNPEPVTLADFPAALTSRFVSRQGKWLLQIYPKDQVWDETPLARFVSDVRSVDPEVTGTPLQNFEASRQIKSSYEDAALYALAVISVVLLIDFLGREHKLLTLLPPLVIVSVAAVTLQTRHGAPHPVLLVGTYIAMAAAIAAVLDFRNFRDAVLALFPPLAGSVLMFGILAIMRVDLNPANLIVLPLILGIGVDNGVHVVHDFRGQTGLYRTSPSTINAIVLTSLTSMIGFGSMMVAAHRGLYSVGLVLVIGLGSCLLVSMVMLPAILAYVANRRSLEILSAKQAQRAARGQSASGKARVA